MTEPVIKRGTARRLGLRTLYAPPGLLIQMPELTPGQFDEFKARFTAEAAAESFRTRFIYPSQSVYVERVPRRLR